RLEGPRDVRMPPEREFGQPRQARAAFANWIIEASRKRRPRQPVFSSALTQANDAAHPIAQREIVRGVAGLGKAPAQADFRAAIVDLDLALLIAPGEFASIHPGTEHFDTVGVGGRQRSRDVGVIASGEAEPNRLGDLERAVRADLALDVVSLGDVLLRSLHG